LNFTLFLPDKNNITIDEAYEQMHQIMQKSFSMDIKTGTIERSYCPGTYDLSINHQKIAGISQRRSGNAVAIMAYISITGDQKKRSQLMKDFYEISDYPKHEKIDFPNIDVHCMENLDKLLNCDLSVKSAKEKILETLIKDNYQIDPQQFLHRF
jgi:Lipoate-protein ligase A